MASEAVLRFLEEHNRPFSINEIQPALKDSFGKTAVQKALDSLVGKNKVKEKIYGKQKIYCIVQKNETSDLKESLLEIDRNINETALQLKDVANKLKNNSAEFADIKGKITLEEALRQKVQLEIDLADVRKQLEHYSEVEAICPKKKLIAETEYEQCLNAYKKRKRMCTDVLNSILENYPKTKKQLFEDIGIETDEDVGFSIEDVNI